MDVAEPLGRSNSTEFQRVLVVLPAFNEARRVGEVISSVPKSFSVGETVWLTEVLVVDDCSTDETQYEARAAGATVVRHLVNCGAGAATRTGLRFGLQCRSDARYIVTMDADGQHLGSDVERIVRFAVTEKADMVVGNRLHLENRGGMPRGRSVGNKLLSVISRVLFGIRVADTQSGLRLMTASAASAVIDFSIDGYGFCTEMLWLAKRKGITIHECPIAVRYSSETLAKGQSSWGVFDLLLDLIWIRITR